jgi:hypothetical protein
MFRTRGNASLVREWMAWPGLCYGLDFPLVAFHGVIGISRNGKKHQSVMEEIRIVNKMD